MNFPEDPLATLPLEEEVLSKKTTSFSSSTEVRIKNWKSHTLNKLMHQTIQYRLYAEIRQRELELQKLKLVELRSRIDKKKRFYSKQARILRYENYFEVVFMPELRAKWEYLVLNGYYDSSISWFVFSESMFQNEPKFLVQNEHTKEWMDIRGQAMKHQQKLLQLKNEFSGEYGQEKFKNLRNHQQRVKQIYVYLMGNAEDAAVADIMFDEMTEEQKEKMTNILFDIDPFSSSSSAFSGSTGSGSGSGFGSGSGSGYGSGEDDLAVQVMFESDKDTFEGGEQLVSNLLQSKLDIKNNSNPDLTNTKETKPKTRPRSKSDASRVSKSLSLSRPKPSEDKNKLKKEEEEKEKAEKVEKVEKVKRSKSRSKSKPVNILTEISDPLFVKVSTETPVKKSSISSNITSKVLENSPLKKKAKKEAWEVSLGELLNTKGSLENLIEMIPEKSWQGFKERVGEFRKQLVEQVKNNNKNFESAGNNNTMTKLNPLAFAPKKYTSTREFMFNEDDPSNEIVWNSLFEKSKSRMFHDEFLDVPTTKTYLQDFEKDTTNTTATSTVMDVATNATKESKKGANKFKNIRILDNIL